MWLGFVQGNIWPVGGGYSYNPGFGFIRFSFLHVLVVICNFLWTVELLRLLTHLRPGLRHFSSFGIIRTVARASVPWRVINVLIDWLIVP